MRRLWFARKNQQKHSLQTENLKWKASNMSFCGFTSTRHRRSYGSQSIQEMVRKQDAIVRIYRDMKWFASVHHHKSEHKVAMAALAGGAQKSLDPLLAFFVIKDHLFAGASKPGHIVRSERKASNQATICVCERQIRKLRMCFVWRLHDSVSMHFAKKLCIKPRHNHHHFRD